MFFNNIFSRSINSLFARYLYNKKTKDIVGYQIKKYQHLMDEMHENKQKQSTPDLTQESNEMKLTNADLIAMNDELNSLITDEMQ